MRTSCDMSNKCNKNKAYYLVLAETVNGCVKATGLSGLRLSSPLELDLCLCQF